MRIRDAKIALVWLLFVIPSMAQSPAAQDSGQAGTLPVFRSHTELVLVPVVVTDKSGHHVTGLHKEDFRLEEDGHEQKVAFFDEIKTTPELVKRASVPAGEYTNALGAYDPTRRLTILVLDTINTAVTDQMRARKAVLKFLEEHVAPDEPISLLAITSRGVRVLHDFTTSPEALVAALKQVNNTASTTDILAGERQAQEEMLDSFRSAMPVDATMQFDVRALERLQQAEESFLAFQERIAVEHTLRALQQIARAFAGVPGRKSMLWATGGIPFILDDPRAFANMNTDLVPLYDETWGALNSANVAVYPIDLSGLLPGRSFDPSRSTPAYNPNRPESRDRYNRLRFSDLDRLTNLRHFASVTGGIACVNNNDIKHCFEAAQEDSREYYILSYYSQPAKGRAEWRKLKVHVHKDGVHVRGRDGYLARPVEDPRATRSSDLGLALTSPLDYTSLPLILRWEDSGATPPDKDGKRHVGFTIFLPRIFIDESDKNHVMLDLAVLARQPSGHTLPPVSRVLDTNLQPTAALDIRKNGFQLHHEIDVSPGEYNVRFVVRDNLSGQMGSVAAPLTVK